MSNDSIGLMKFAYQPGNNPFDETAYFYCGDCGLELLDDEVGFVAAGSEYANGEFARCPSCGKEHSVYRVREE